MQHSHKLVLNSVVSVARIVVNGAVTLLATRIALKALGADDYGIFNLIAGVITLLSFINGALMVSAQRFYSISIGQNDKSLLNELFNASVSLHIIIGVLIGILFIVLKSWLFSGFLNITDDKIDVAIKVYDLMVLSAVLTVIGVPYSAIINAYEDMTVLAISSVVSNIIKLVAAVVLLYIDSNLLLVFTGITVLSVIVKLLIELLWSNCQYETSRIRLAHLLDTRHYRRMVGFIGWNTLGTAGVLVRNQGVAVVLNVFFGTIINSVYGIANQVNSLVLSFASTITTIFTPSIIQAKGAGENTRMLTVSILSSKLSFFVSSLMAIPILGFTKEVLDIWLSDYPEKTDIFCQYIIISFLVSQLFPGINRAILAEGKIKWYEIFTFLFFIFIIPVSVFLFRFGFPSETIMVLMVISQIGVLFLTILYAKKHCGLSVKEFLFRSTLCPTLIFAIAQLTLLGGRRIFDSISMQLVWLSLCLILYGILFWALVLTKGEKGLFKQLLNSYFR